jgi:trk system potassium uptake protein TrkA
MRRQYAVIGLGRVGAALVATLDSLGHDVLGIDCDEEIVQNLSAEVPNANLVASDDATDGIVLRDLGIESFDGVAVTIGEDVEASVLVTLILKDLGVPLILARANSSLHARVLERVGADRVVQPEREFGEFLAHQMASPGIQDYLELGGNAAIARITVPGNWVGKSLSELRLPDREGVNVITLEREGRDAVIPRAGDTLKEGDVLVLGGPKKRLAELEDRMG